MASQILSILQLNIPNLKSVYLQVDMNFDNRSAAPFAITHKLCRDILKIFEDANGCLIAPDDDLSSIHLIINEQMMCEKDFQEFLNVQRIFVKFTTKCDSLAIDKCLRYTFFYWMEERGWCKMNFSAFEPHCVSSGEVFMKFSAELVKAYPFEEWLLDHIDRFRDDREVSKRISARWVTCLPNLGKGRIVKMYRQIPESSPFQNYTQMKSYWKNTYGYILPANPPDTYYDVVFQDKTMLYPFFCVLPTPPQPIPYKKDTDRLANALQEFLKDFRQITRRTLDAQISGKS
ncbi:unnamed protein product [Caenorhabditis bovis]|uniref:DUF4708 domain-containing protein n=1 Tax=Caenorhabditis bovis TaxID=2654633 RepID=A0A8S1F791_9PELO|nr:unnamed protein product [Caenorhabditis bovis]